ncbi:PDZ and LIM domain protein 3 isoform X2 [Phymastichus coffea]|uniref:PDZ and LIM domain protein 3 isoform X2 n=1 Tax=Phymastichus coffea TaxID=108790 RepID=UPI00273B09D3|nr:PDZ and LIM domain protein 3 isoform X2 [Phymastichus coffea]
MTKRQTLIVRIRRPCKSVSWGISIAGGSDLGTPLVVTRSENDDLQRGDVIKKIDEYDVRDLRHVDAQNLLKNSESVKLAIERSGLPHATSCASSHDQSDSDSAVASSDRCSFNSKQKSQQIPPILPKSPVPPPLPVEVPEPQRIFSPVHFNPAHDHLDEVREERYYLSQPYRTTPLVLPGAKIKKDAPLGECYLRHHPNPMVRAPPHHYEVANPEVAMKQKVVSQQFNTPIGLYSEQNIADTIKCQASAIPTKPGAKWDPNQSEAYKALQEEGDHSVSRVSQPTRQGVFSPQRPRQSGPNTNPWRPKSPAINIYDNDGEQIHQSNSFKRIMYTVLGQTDY